MPRKRGNGEGSIYQAKDGRWRGEISLGWKNGKANRKIVYGQTRGEVSDLLKKLLREQQLGYELRPERQTVAQFLTTWLEQSAKPRIKPSTYQSYSWLIREHLVPNLGSIILEKLSPPQVQKLLNEKLESGLSNRTVQHMHATLRTALDQAEKWALVPRNVAKLVDGPRIRRHEIAPMNPAQAKAFLSAVEGDRLEALYSVAMAVGLRLGEALGLSWNDVNLDTGSLTVRRALQRVNGKLTFVEPKSARSRRTVRLPQVCIAALHRHRLRQGEERMWAGSRWQDNGLVFASTIGTPLDGPNVTHRFQKALQAAGLPKMRFHDLRHTAASLLLAQGIHARVVMEILGHSQISLTLNTYSHVIPALQDEAAAKMDAILGQEIGAVDRQRNIGVN